MTDDRHRVIPSLIGMLKDVDTSTVAPANGDTLQWSSATKKWHPITGSGFDPNENPVIIGLLATAGSSSTPNNVSTGFTGAVVIGNTAQVLAAYGVAIGRAAAAQSQSASAVGDGAIAYNIGDVAIGQGAGTANSSGSWQGLVAIGQSASTNGIDSVAIGKLASTVGNRTTAVGKSATASANDASAFGKGATASHAAATAIGQLAASTKAFQIMLGTSDTFVEIPGNSGTSPNGLVLTDTATGTRYIVRITSGALVLSAAP